MWRRKFQIPAYELIWRFVVLVGLSVIVIGHIAIIQLFEEFLDLSPVFAKFPLKES